MCFQCWEKGIAARRLCEVFADLCVRFRTRVFFLCGKTGQIKIRYKLGGRLGNINEIVLYCFPGASSGDPLNEF